MHVMLPKYSSNPKCSLSIFVNDCNAGDESLDLVWDPEALDCFNNALRAWRPSTILDVTGANMVNINKGMLR